MAERAVPPPLPQNPSPMTDSLRIHGRVPDTPLSGRRWEVERVLPTPVQVFVPQHVGQAAAGLLIHFHGGAQAAEYAAHVSRREWVVATVSLGAGSRVYEEPFRAAGTFQALVEQVRAAAGLPLPEIALSAFSAGYGAVRAVLQQDAERIGSIVLLDALHTGYDPDGTPLALGGRLEEAGLEPFVAYARRAAAGQRRFLLSHSAVFPGTFASTTECADLLLERLSLKRRPVLQWGPLGMQLLSLAGRGHFAVLGFAGNSAPDHMDHLHALFHLLQRAHC